VVEAGKHAQRGRRKAGRGRRGEAGIGAVPVEAGLAAWGLRPRGMYVFCGRVLMPKVWLQIVIRKSMGNWAELEW
jgi:hypothetical protein